MDILCHGLKFKNILVITGWHKFDYCAVLQRFRNMKLKNFSSGMYARLGFATAVAEPGVTLN